MLKNIFSERRIIFVLIAIITIIVRIYLSFSTDLIAGMDGGYYPLQVRNVLNTGFLGFSDVPLYFYFCALLVKVITIFGFAQSNETIINVIKIVDSIALPLLVIPLFNILSKKENKIPFYAEIAIVLFAVFSFPSFRMLGDLQKNGFAIPFLLAFIYFAERYFAENQRRDMVYAIITLLIISLIHFGVFVFSLAFLIVLLVIVYRKKAVIPSLLLFLVGFLLVLLFDYDRAMRLITFWNVIFDNSAEFSEPVPPPVLLNMLLSYALVIFAMFQYKKHNHTVDKTTLNMIIVLVVLIVVFAFPLYESQYILRFNALLFIPQALLILQLIRINKKLTIPFSGFLFLATAFSLVTNFHEGKKSVIGRLAYEDLQNLNKFITGNRDSTIIITRHGIEFWTAWALEVKVGNDRGMDKLNLDNYKNVIFLQPKQEAGKKPIGMHPQHEPPIPKNSQLVYSSAYFNAYQLKN